MSSPSWIQWVRDRDWAKLLPCLIFFVTIFKLSGNLECHRQTYSGVRDISEILTDEKLKVPDYSTSK